jgi:hypothetical protein
LLLLLALPIALAAGNVKLRNGAVHGEGDESKDED